MILERRTVEMITFREVATVANRYMTKITSSQSGHRHEEVDQEMYCAS